MPDVLESEEREKMIENIYTVIHGFFIFYDKLMIFTQCIRCLNHDR